VECKGQLATGILSLNSRNRRREMMNKINKFCFFGLVSILAVTLAFIGVKVTEAKKPIKAEWKVAIPVSAEREDPLPDLNLTGIRQGSGDDAIFENQDSVHVGVDETRHGGVFKTFFNLRLAPNTSGYGVQINGVNLDRHCIELNEKQCLFPYSCSTSPVCYTCDKVNLNCDCDPEVDLECVVPCPDCTSPENPNRVDCSDVECSDLVCVDCMECALNQKYPTSAEETYPYAIWLTVGTDQDIEGPDPVGGRLYLHLLDHGDPLDYQAMTCESTWKTVTIEKTGPDEWTITNKSDYGGDTYLTCQEWYQARYDENGKLLPPPKRDDRTVMKAKAVAPFVFEMIWTKK
jgi:hypothetical protein